MLEENIRAKLAAAVKPEDLQSLPPAALQAISVLGLAKFVELSYAVGGISFYVPKFESLIAQARNRMILEEADGHNYTALAIKYDISEVWVRQIVNQDRAKKNFISLFDTVPPE